jgi:peptidoglycan/LPS O-acetylase OafA/YrhL
VEWQFYIIFPLMLLAYRRLGTALVFFGFAMLFSSYAFYGYTDPLLKWLFRIPPDLMKAIGAMSTIWFPRNLVFFAGGALLFRLFEAGLILGFDANTRSVIGKTGWVILAVICWISVPEMQPDPIVPFYRHALVCLFFMALFVFVAIGQPFLIVNSLVCKLGTLSYSIYILHFSGLRIAHWLIDQYFGMTSSSSFRCPAIFVVTIVVTWLAAEVTWRLVEKPGIWIGRWVSKTLLPSRCFVSIFKRAEVENPVKI